MKLRILFLGLSLFLLGATVVPALAQQDIILPPEHMRTNAYQQLMSKGKSQYNKKQYKSALSTFKQALKKYPNKKSEIQPWINKCNARLEEAAQRERQRQEAARQEQAAAEQRAREEAELRAREEAARQEAAQRERERLEAERRAREEAARQEAAQREREEMVYNVVEIMPTFPRGEAALLKWVSKNLEYPSIAKSQKIQGVVVVRFVVLEDGTVGDVVVQKGLHPECDKAAVKCVKSLPRFTPGMQQGKPVRVWYTLPIRFTNR